MGVLLTMTRADVLTCVPAAVAAAALSCRVFNKKLARSFDKYTVEIRQNLERGTAL